MLQYQAPKTQQELFQDLKPKHVTQHEIKAIVCCINDSFFENDWQEDIYSTNFPNLPKPIRNFDLLLPILQGAKAMGIEVKFDNQIEQTNGDPNTMGFLIDYLNTQYGLEIDHEFANHEANKIVILAPRGTYSTQGYIFSPMPQANAYYASYLTGLAAMLGITTHSSLGDIAKDYNKAITRRLSYENKADSEDEVIYEDVSLVAPQSDEHDATLATNAAIAQTEREPWEYQAYHRRNMLAVEDTLKIIHASITQSQHGASLYQTQAFDVAAHRQDPPSRNAVSVDSANSSTGQYALWKQRQGQSASPTEEQHYDGLPIAASESGSNYRALPDAAATQQALLDQPDYSHDSNTQLVFNDSNATSVATSPRTQTIADALQGNPPANQQQPTTSTRRKIVNNGIGAAVGTGTFFATQASVASAISKSLQDTSTMSPEVADYTANTVTFVFGAAAFLATKAAVEHGPRLFQHCSQKVKDLRENRHHWHQARANERTEDHDQLLTADGSQYYGT